MQPGSSAEELAAQMEGTALSTSSTAAPAGQIIQVPSTQQSDTADPSQHLQHSSVSDHAELPAVSLRSSGHTLHACCMPVTASSESPPKTTARALDAALLAITVGGALCL